MLVFMDKQVEAVYAIPTYRFITPVLFSDVKALCDYDAKLEVNRRFMGYFTAERGEWLQTGEREFTWLEYV
ncbi:hypothetical protein D3C87_637140 [compost metagenome]